MSNPHELCATCGGVGGVGGVDLPALVAQLRRLGVAKYRIGDLELILGPAPVSEAASVTEPLTPQQVKAAHYKKLLGRDVDPKILEQLP